MFETPESSSDERKPLLKRKPLLNTDSDSDSDNHALIVQPYGPETTTGDTGNLYIATQLLALTATLIYYGIANFGSIDRSSHPEDDSAPVFPPESALKIALLCTLASWIANLGLTYFGIRGVFQNVPRIKKRIENLCGPAKTIAKVAVGTATVFGVCAAIPSAYAAMVGRKDAYELMGIPKCYDTSGEQALFWFGNASLGLVNGLIFNTPEFLVLLLQSLDKYCRVKNWSFPDDDGKSRKHAELAALTGPAQVSEILKNPQKILKLKTALDALDSPNIEHLLCVIAGLSPDEEIQYGSFSSAVREALWSSDADLSTSTKVKNLVSLGAAGFSTAGFYAATSKETRDFFEIFGAPAEAATVIGYGSNLAQGAFCLSYGQNGGRLILSPGSIKKGLLLYGILLPITALTLAPTALQAGGINTGFVSLASLLSGMLANIVGVNTLATKLTSYSPCCLTEVDKARETLEQTLTDGIEKMWAGRLDPGIFKEKLKEAIDNLIEADSVLSKRIGSLSSRDDTKIAGSQTTHDTFGMSCQL